jgi:hypothetical protein
MDATPQIDTVNADPNSWIMFVPVTDEVIFRDELPDTWTPRLTEEYVNLISWVLYE